MQDDERATVLAAADRAASTLHQSVAGKPPETPIETDAGSLRRLAEVIAALHHDARQCGGADCMGRRVDGVKLWVTQDRLDSAEQRAARYEATLIAIARAVPEDGGEMDLLIDWQGTARALADEARAALREDGDDRTALDQARTTP